MKLDVSATIVAMTTKQRQFALSLMEQLDDAEAGRFISHLKAQVDLKRRFSFGRGSSNLSFKQTRLLSE